MFSTMCWISATVYISIAQIPCTLHILIFRSGFFYFLHLASSRSKRWKSFAAMFIFCRKNPLNLSSQASVHRRNNRTMRSWTKHHTPGTEEANAACGHHGRKPHIKPQKHHRLDSPLQTSGPAAGRVLHWIFYHNVHQWIVTRELNTVSVRFQPWPSVCFGIFETTKIQIPIIVKFGEKFWISVGT